MTMFKGMLKAVLENKDPEDDEPVRTEGDLRDTWPFDLPEKINADLRSLRFRDNEEIYLLESRERRQWRYQGLLYIKNMPEL